MTIISWSHDTDDPQAHFWCNIKNVLQNQNLEMEHQGLKVYKVFFQKWWPLVDLDKINGNGIFAFLAVLEAFI